MCAWIINNQYCNYKNNNEIFIKIIDFFFKKERDNNIEKTF